MKAVASDWLAFGLALIGSILAIAVTVGLLNLTGDCAPGAADCGETQRRISFVVLGLGVAWIVYLVLRFIRSPGKFR